MSQQFKEMFDKEVPHFLKVWDKVRKTGFFEYISIAISGSTAGYLDGPFVLTVEIFGYLPKESKYRLQGVSPYLDLKALLNNVHHNLQEGEFELGDFESEVEYKDWNLYADEEEERVIGRKGNKVSGNLVLVLRRKEK